MSNNLDEMMGKLKKQYDDLPTQSSQDRIMAQVKKEKKSNLMMFFRQWQAVAMIIAALGIGSILTLNQFGFQSTENESMNIAGSEENAMMVAPTDPKTEVYKGSQDEVEIALLPEEDKQMMVGSVDEETKSITVDREGQEESLTVKRMADEYLGFSTYIDESFEVTPPLKTEESYSIQVFAHFANEKIEPHIFSITEYNEEFSSVEDVVSHVRELHADYDITEDKLFSDRRPDLVSSEMMVVMDDLLKYVAIVEKEGRYYVLETNLFGEEQEAFYTHLNYILEEFNWIQP